MRRVEEKVVSQPACVSYPKFVLQKITIGAAATIVVAGIYRLVGELTLDRSFGTNLMIPLDEKIPFWPETVIFYLSIYLFWLPPILSTSVSVKEFWKIVLAVGIALLIGFILHFIIPAAYNRQTIPEVIAETNVVTYWATIIVQNLYLADLPNNTFPSSHVLTVTVLLIMMRPRSDRWAYRLYVLWGIAIILSTLTVKQHHLLDVIAAVFISLAVKNWIFKKLWPVLWAKFPHKKPS